MGEQDVNQEELKYAKRLQSILTFFIIFGALGLLAIIVYGLITYSFGTCVMWALACLMCGASVGFLFGIPKTSQGSASSKTDTNTPDYQLHVNTNLTEISDWLTKIIVGLGLVKLTKLPPYLTSMATTFAAGIGDKIHAVAMAFAYGTICFFSILGFLFGYLFTRLFLSKALSIADQDSLKKSNAGIQIQLASIESTQGLLVHKVVQDGNAAATAQAQKAPGTPNPQMDELAKMGTDYMTISIADWAERTRAKDAKANEMAAFALKNGLLPQTIFDYIQSHLPVQEGLVLALATVINFDPHQTDLQLLMPVSQKLERLHVRYRVLLAIVTLNKKGFIADNDKQSVIDLVKSYKTKADNSLLEQIDHTLSFLNS
jgi:hypothetical protein